MNYFKATLLKSNKCIVLIASIILLTACDSVFEFSPYEARVKKENENTTAENLQLIESLQSASDDFKFAFITDTHFFFTNLRNVINDINRNEEILFVVFGGDITDQGLLKEYELFYNIAEKLEKPYLTVIGNHDYRLNGGVIYERMFGDYNYSFEFNHSKFILFDDVVWESYKDPDFNWLSKRLSKRAKYNHLFVIAHIPPFSGQFDDDMERRYKTLMQENNVSMSIHGHTHSYLYEKIYDDNVNYLIAPTIKQPAYCIISVDEESFDVELIEL